MTNPDAMTTETLPDPAAGWERAASRDVAAQCAESLERSRELRVAAAARRRWNRTRALVVIGSLPIIYNLATDPRWELPL